jgi:transcription initiation factor TFIIIB Brf1 subunit/transcription initiation factor TFIIB
MDLSEIWKTVDSIRSKSENSDCANVVLNECNCGVEIQDRINGDIICMECGTIKAERVEMAQDQFDSNDNRVMLESSKDEFFENKQVSTRIGRTWGIKHAPSNLFKKLHQHTSINQHQFSRSKEFAEIDRICEVLNTTGVVANGAKHYFNNLCKTKTFRGINRTAMKGCVILRSLKDNNVSRDVSEMLSACHIQKKTVLTRNIKIYEEMYGCKLLQERKCQEVYRYLQRLGIQDKQIYKLSNEIISKRKQYNDQLLFQGKSPKIVYAIILKELGFTKRNICDALQVSLTAF